jgi:predicted lipid-binding transport protein (Tim44 family)
MHKTKELKLLMALLKANEKKPASPAKRFAANLIIWLLIGLAGGFAYNQFGTIGTVELIALCFTLIAGVVIGIMSMCDISRNQWPAIQPHINLESIKERIRELET